MVDLEATPADELYQLFNDYWSYEMVINPFAATANGDYQFNDRVPDVSPGAYKAQLEANQEFQLRLQGIDVSKVPEELRLSAEVLSFILKHRLALGEFDTWRIPFVADWGFQIEFGHVVDLTPFKNETDYRNYLKRLGALPGFLGQHVENMRVGLEDGFTQPAEILGNILPSFDAQVTDTIEEHSLYAPFRNMPDSLSKAVQTELVSEGRQLLSKEVIPAFARVADFMRETYLSGANKKLGASSLPNGHAYYGALVRYFTTLDDATPESIHQRGLKEVKRIREEMDAIIAELGFQGSFSDFQEFLRTDSQFYPKTAEELLMKAAWIAKQTDGRLPAFFGKLPRQPYSVEPVPQQLAPNFTAGRYSPAPVGSSRGGEYWVNTYALETRSLYQLVALTLHEGVPGHHLQIALAQELEGMPEFRTQFYPHAFGEGWGLYSEKLGVEMGIYETLYDHFGRLSYEMWRACRLVVDTGLHAMKWSRQEAVEYLKTNTALSLHEVGTEVDRYIAWPGQALAYKMGELTIWELRHEAEDALGEAFDIRSFHDAVLAQGGIPLDMLRSQIAAYIEREKK